jgi:hypothetical protein
VGKARELAERLTSGKIPDPAGAPLTAIFLEPGGIAFEDEILTSRLRWHLVSLLAERLRSCDALWICDSPNYFTSWWTRAELVLCRYLEAAGRGQRRIEIWRYDPASRKSSSADGIVPALTEGQRRRVDRLLSNTGRSMGAETVRLSGRRRCHVICGTRSASAGGRRRRAASTARLSRCRCSARRGSSTEPWKTLSETTVPA